MTFSHVSLGVKHRALGDKRTVCRAHAQPSTRLTKTLLSVALMSAMALMSVEAAEVIDDRHAEAVDYGTALTSINAPDGYRLKVNSLSIPSFKIEGSPVTVELGSGGLTVRDNYSLVDEGRFLHFVGTGANRASLNGGQSINVNGGTLNFSQMGHIAWQGYYWVHNAGHSTITDTAGFAGEQLFVQEGAELTLTRVGVLNVDQRVDLASGTWTIEDTQSVNLSAYFQLSQGVYRVNDVGSLTQDRSYYLGNVHVENVDALTFTAPQAIMGSGSDAHHWLKIGSVTLDMAPQPLNYFPTFLTGFYASYTDNRIQTGAFTSDVRYQRSSCAQTCSFDAIQSYSSLFSIGQLQIDVSGDTVIRSNSDVPLPLVSGTGFGQANGLTRIGNRSVSLLKVGMAADGTHGELTLNTEGTNTFAFYDLEANLSPREPQGFLMAHLYAYRGRLAVTGAANTFTFDRQRDVSPDGVVNLATWWGFSTAVNSFSGGDVEVNATQGDNTIVIDKPASYVRGVSVSPYNAEAWIRLTAPQGMNRIVLAPIVPETVNHVEDNLLGDTTGVYAALYGRASDVPETLTWDRAHVQLDALENVVTLRTTSRDSFGVSAANGAYAELLARSGDNTVDMATRQLINGYFHFGLYANGTARVSEVAPLGENRVSVSSHCTGDEGPLQGLTRGVMVFDKGEAYLTGKGNRVTVESSLESNVGDKTAGIAINDEGIVRLRATETGNTVTVKAKDGVGITIQPTASGERSGAEITLEALGEGNNTVEATRALLVRLGSVTMTTERGENRLLAERDAILIEGNVLPETGRVTIDGKQTIVSKTGLAINAQPTAEEWFDIQLHYAQDSRIQGDLYALNGVATDISPRNDAEPGTMMLQGNATFFNGARLDLTLTPGSR